MQNDAAPTGVYDAAYHADLSAGARRSATRVLQRVLDLVGPASVVDFGCGSGEWLAEAMALGIEDVLGLDGPWVDPLRVVIPAHRFRNVDLDLPVDLGRRFDLALCLEVAEHLPPEAGSTLVASLTRHAPVVLFSAAVPGQGGEGHVAEAWPSHWRTLFAAQGFACHDVMRGALWDEQAIEAWYRQNTMLFVAETQLASDPGLAARLQDAAGAPFDIVHPVFLTEARTEIAAHDAEAARLRQETARLGQEWQAQADALAKARAELDALRSSGSWRLTAPLRQIATALRSRFQGPR